MLRILKVEARPSQRGVQHRSSRRSCQRRSSQRGAQLGSSRPSFRDIAIYYYARWRSFNAPHYSGDHWPASWTTQQVQDSEKYYKAMPEEFTRNPDCRLLHLQIFLNGATTWDIDASVVVSENVSLDPDAYRLPVTCNCCALPHLSITDTGGICDRHSIRQWSTQVSWTRLVPAGTHPNAVLG